MIELALERRDVSIKNISEDFVDAAVALGESFIGCGGPVSRLETLIVAAGQSRNLNVSIQATPSTLIVSCTDFKTPLVTRSIRIFQSEINLARLRTVDKVLRKFTQDKLNSRQALKSLNRLKNLSTDVALWKRTLSLLGIGFSSSIINGADPLQGLVAGLVTSLIFLFIEQLSKGFIHNQFFKVFAMSFSALLFAALIEVFFNWPSYPFAIGVFAYIVPGLLLTTAVSELVDQNFLSACIRLLKSLAVFLSMAMAYFLIKDLASVLGNLENFFSDSYSSWIYSDFLITKLICSAIMIICFSIEFKAHRKSLLRILLCGLIGAFTFNVTALLGQMYLSVFVSSFAIGLVSYKISRKYKHPSQIYSVPSILSLVPGMIAFTEFQGVNTNSSNALVRALLISLAIVFGLICSRLKKDDVT